MLKSKQAERKRYSLDSAKKKDQYSQLYGYVADTKQVIKVDRDLPQTIKGNRHTKMNIEVNNISIT